jgi:hypothetical protein
MIGKCAGNENLCIMSNFIVRLGIDGEQQRIDTVGGDFDPVAFQRGPL